MEALNMPDKEPTSRTGEPSKNPTKLSRREFLKLLGVGAGAVALSAYGVKPLEVGSEEKSSGSPTSTASSAETPEITGKLLQPEVVHGVKVFGLKEKITSEAQILQMYEALDQTFANKHNIRIGNKPEQRKEILDPKERYLEVVITQSAYNSFLKRKQETKMDFVQWVQAHLELMNMCFEHTPSPSGMKAILKRILVVDDKMPNAFWNKEQGHALDVAWRGKFWRKFPIDTDTSWAISNDYRKDSMDYVWSCRIEDEDAVLTWSSYGDGPKRTYRYPATPNLKDLIGNAVIEIDWGFPHELSHQLANLPDQSRFDTWGISTVAQFPNFDFNPEGAHQTVPYNNTGNFQEPFLGSYLSFLLKRNIDSKFRNPIVGEECQLWNYSNRPKNITVEASCNNPIDNIEVRRVRLKSDYLGNRSFPEQADQKVPGNIIKLKDNLFEDFPGGSHVWLITLNDAEGGVVGEVYLPAAAFNMSKIAGLEDARYNIRFTSISRGSKTKQMIYCVEDRDRKIFNEHHDEENLYAEMKVEGTNTSFLWFLKD